MFSWMALFAAEVEKELDWMVEDGLTWELRAEMVAPS